MSDTKLKRIFPAIPARLHSGLKARAAELGMSLQRLVVTLLDGAMTEHYRRHPDKEPPFHPSNHHD